MVSVRAKCPLGAQKTVRGQPRQPLTFHRLRMPVGAGLSSSAALEASVAVALNDLWVLGRGHPDLALAGPASGK